MDIRDALKLFPLRSPIFLSDGIVTDGDLFVPSPQTEGIRAHVPERRDLSSVLPRRKGDPLSFDQTDGAIIVASGPIRHRVRANADPVIPAPPEPQGEGVAIGMDDLRWLARAMSEDLFQGNMHGLIVGDGHAVATDGHRMHVLELGGETPSLFVDRGVIKAVMRWKVPEVTLYANAITAPNGAIVRVPERREALLPWRAVFDNAVNARETEAFRIPAEVIPFLRLAKDEETIWTGDGVTISETGSSIALDTPRLAKRHAYRARYVLDAIDGMASPEGWHGDTTRAAPAVLRDGGRTAIVMPINLDRKRR